MLSAKTLLSGLAGIALLIGVPAFAQTQATGQSNQGAKPKDPNRIICEKIQDTGSRVASSKVCMTAQQWEEKRRNDRAYVEDSQQRSLEPNSG
jgi:hypothetical protein